MPTFEDEIFEFLTSEANYKAMLKARDYFPVIKERLISELWEKVYNGLEEFCSKNPTWKAVKEANLNSEWSKVYIYMTEEKREKNGLPPFLIGWERLAQSYPYYGFWVNKEGTVYDFEKIMAYFEQERSSFEKIDSIQDINDEWWGFWGKPLKLDFNIDITLVDILPKHLERTSNDFIQKIIHIEEMMSKDKHLENILMLKK